MRSPDLRGCLLRVRLAEFALLLAFLVLAARAAHLSLLEPRAAARGAAQVVSVLRLAPERGMIVDREGAELAITLDAPSVYAVPAEVRDPNATAQAVARALGRPARALGHRLREAESFVFLARWVEPEHAERVKQLGLPGIGVLYEPRRTYPHRELAGALLGFANIDGVGVRGVERLENDWLRGTRRRVPVERDAKGRLLLGPGLDPGQTAGGDVALTLDAAFQADAEAALADAVEATGARGGFVVTLDATNGDVLALAERPSFDPNRFRSVPYAETRSRVFLDALEPGSVLKTFVVAAALEAGVVQPDDVVELEGGTLRVPGKTIRDLHPREQLDVAGVLRVSSNVGAVKLAQLLGERSHFEALRRFGFGAATGSGFPEESSGLLRPWRRWKPIDRATIAFGQGVNVTPIQLAAATAALARDGIWLRPRLVAARRRPGAPWKAIPADSGRRVVSARTARQMRAMLEAVVGPDGTGGRAALVGVRVAGKTGTAQKLDPESESYAANRYLAWFAGLAPTDAPRMVSVVGLDEPGRQVHTGGAAAAPLFARVTAAHLTRLGIPTKPAMPRPVYRVAAARGTAAGRPAQEETNQVSAPEGGAQAAGRTPRTTSEGGRQDAPDRDPRPAPSGARPDPLPKVARAGNRVLLPDLLGLTVAEVKQITARASLEVEIVGRGRAVAQHPEPGTILAGTAPRVQVRFEPDGREG